MKSGGGIKRLVFHGQHMIPIGLVNVEDLLLFKILFGVSYRTIASATNDLKIYQALDMKRTPCYKTIPYYPN